MRKSDTFRDGPPTHLGGTTVFGGLALLHRLIGVGSVHVLRDLDDFLLRDIGASGDDIWRVHRLRNGERPTLMVG